MVLRIRMISALLGLIVLAACSGLPLAGTNNAAGESLLLGNRLTPREAVEQFLNAWNEENFDQMYALLNPRSTSIYPASAFRAQYTQTHGDIGFGGISYTINDVQMQGTSAAVHYDVTLTTSTFGDIVDEGRTMRLVESNGVWTLAWSPMDIINGMTANVRLDPSRSFAPRANIYDRNGLPLVQENGTTVALYGRLSDMRGQDECTALMSRVTLRPISYFNRLYIDYSAADSVFFVGELDSETYNRYAAELRNVCGTDVEVEFFGSKVRTSTGRTYFGHGAASHVTGYIGFIPAAGESDLDAEYWRQRGYDSRDWVGLAGVEFAYQDALAGTPDQSLRLIDSSGVILRTLGSAEGSSPYPVTMTIDRDLQWDTAQAFVDAWNYAAPNWVTRATGGAAVVMDVNTGAVLSMFSFPTYDPRIFYPDSTYYATTTTYAAAGQQIGRAYSNDRFLPLGPQIINRAYSEQYAPGSVFKIVSVLGAADAGVWQPERIFDCQLRWEGLDYGDTIDFREDWRVVSERDPAGEITMSQALTASCNPFFWEVGALMFQQDANMLANYATQFGFGQRTNLVGLAAEREASGRIPQPTGVDAALNNVIGQGDTSTTALQMARLTAAVANGGTLYQPYMVQRVGGVDSTDEVTVIQPDGSEMLGVSAMALAVTREGMCDVTTDENLGTSYRIFGNAPYSSCGKTGTAQAGDAPNAWYVAFAPAENPQIAVAVVVPRSREGSEVAAPITRRILDRYFNVPAEPFPDWWETDYIPVEPPRGVGGIASADG